MTSPRWQQLMRCAVLCVAVGLIAIPAASLAQVLLPGAAPSSIPPMAPPPSPPTLTVPAVPKLADPPPLTHERIQPAPELPRAKLRRHRSFGDRIQDCLNDSTAAQLAPADRAAYSRACATR